MDLLGLLFIVAAVPDIGVVMATDAILVAGPAESPRLRLWLPVLVLGPGLSATFAIWCNLKPKKARDGQ